MQRNEMVALVAGASVGILGGALGVFLASIAGGTVVRRFLVELDDRYIELGQPPSPAAQHGAQRVKSASASAAAASDPPLPRGQEMVTAARQAVSRQVAVAGTPR